MLNLIEAVRGNPSMRKLEIGNFVFAEFTCGIGAERLALWSPSDYIVNVITGKKTWQTSEGAWTANPGETLFFKKGAAMVNQHFEVDFCLLMFFIPDGLVRSMVRELAPTLGNPPATVAPMGSASRLENDVALAAFLQSMRTYFSSTEKPSEVLLQLKLKELVISILTSGRNQTLAAYLRKMGESDVPSVSEIMEANFLFNLSLEDYAKLCHRSLSSFKREFQACYQESPGKWLLRRRLEHAATLLRNSKLTVTEVAYDCAFEDSSHFSRVFKERYGMPPVAYRDGALVVV
jgi:AraC family transcriptional regulator, exoenzyme S synthesis regulatory protein ExsA